MLPVPAVHLDDGGLVTIGIGIRGRATECLGPVSGESLDMLGVEAVAERMTDHLVDHHPTMPGVGKTAQAVVATRRLEDSLHASMMTILPCLYKTMALASSDGHPTGPTEYGSRLVAKGRAIPPGRSSVARDRGNSPYAVTQDLSADGRPPPSIDDFKRSGECSPDSGKEIEIYTHQGPIIG